MPEMLETVMLICFGLSWPISLIKNYRSRTAAGMSLPFILLIIAGYLAGITAKLMSGAITYVMAAYLFNLIMVAANLAIYHRNLRLDARREASAA